MSVREYIGARYVPIMMGEWDNTKAYEPLTVVSYQGNSFTSRQYVPIGIDIDDADFWAETGNYNAQVEAYRQEVQTFDGRITANEDAIRDLSSDMADALYGLAVRQSQNAIMPMLLGTIVYSKQNGMYDHPGCICDLGNGIQWLFSSPQNQIDNMGHARSISIENDLDNVTGYYSIETGHANSAAYDPVGNKIYLAPIWDYTGNPPILPYATYLYQFTPGSNTVTKITVPEPIMSVSYDLVESKLYALAYSGVIYEIDTATYIFTAAKTIGRPTEYNQDFAIHDGKWVVSSPSGYFIVGTLANDEVAIMDVSHIDSSYMFVWGEIDGMEFNENGNLIAVAHSDQLDDMPTFIYEIPIFDDVAPMFDFLMKNTWTIGANYTLYVKQDNQKLRCDGFSGTAGLKSLNFLNLLADTTQRSIVLQSDYTCDNLRIGNDTYNWISLNEKTLEIKDTLTIQTPVIFNGKGTVKIKKPIVVAYGISRIGFAGKAAITVDTETYLLASYPVGTFVSFGTLDAISPSGLTLYNGADEAIDENQVYILGTLLNS